jgi:signal transduction histidine kinase
VSIRSRLAASYGAGVVLTLLIVGLFVHWQMGSALRSSLATTLQTRAAGVMSSLENAGQAGLQEADTTAPGAFAALFTADGTLIDSSTDAPAGIRPANGVVVVAGHAYLVLTQAAPDGSTVVTGADFQPIDDAQAALARLLIGVGLAVGAASLSGGWLLAGRALRPVDRLIVDAGELGPGDLHRRLAPPARLDEVGRLTLTLNGMLDRIAESAERQRLFVAMASHELRTPLAALRAELDLVERGPSKLDEYRAAVHAAQGDAIRLTNLANSLLEFAAMPEDARAISRSPVRLRLLIRSVIRGVEPLARQRGVTIELDAPDVVVWVDRARIEHAIGNLLHNAVTYGGSGGRVEIVGRVDGRPADRTLRVEVLDRGPGIGGDVPEELFTPFRRGTDARGTGSGLGLATVASAIQAHEGTYGAGDRADAGARFWFSVPCDRDDPRAAEVPAADRPLIA